ncbi:hypothetical protein DDE74_03155 [Streptomyces lydicus]|uniref:Uncharacterized protein n=1 Tax=Streptomyces lydicus TaxID=47763 RepID=A0A3S9Y504_9ACTN|nr:hypothetical protein [Streptomyces lydicus]AZS70070.1 hypothetical protein DDE74_03155 [Streptomyces lydicus]
MHISTEQQTAVRRWKLGHHVFHLHLTVMNTYLASLEKSIDEEDWRSVTPLLTKLSRLYGAATSCMRYASDFPETAYESLIRPSMEPPWLNPGFSGKFNSDHERMLDLMRTIRTSLKRAIRSGKVPEEVEKAATQLWRAQSHNRANHKLICEKFVPGGQSLLQDYFNANA